jgi:superfamily II DNA or RNA helicase
VIGDDEREANAAVAIDKAFADRFAPILEQIGIGDLPRELWLPRSRSAEMDAFERAADDYYRKHARLYSIPSMGVLRIVERYPSLEGADYLERLEGMPRARLTKLLLERLARSDPSPVRFGGVGSRSTEYRYSPLLLPNPSVWKLWKHGTWSIGERIVQLAAAIEVRREIVSKPELLDIAGLLPDDAPLLRHWVGEFPEPRAPAEPVWRALLASRHTRAHDELRALWIEAAARGHVPETVPDPFGEGEVELASVLLAESAEDFALAERARLTAVLLPAPTRAVWRKKGAQELGPRIQTRVLGEPSSPLPASEDVPGLATYLAGPDPAVRMVDRIERQLGEAVSDPGVIAREGELLVSRAWAQRVTPSVLLHKKLDVLARLTKFNQPLAEMIEALDPSEVERRRAAVRAEPDLPSRLLAAAGGMEALRQSLPESAERALDDEVDELALAQLCLDIHGPGALRAIEAALSERGLEPPDRWGTDEARQFVQALGFPLSFAGAANPRPPAELLVQGPRPLPPLHGFQESVLAELEALVESGQPRRRAVLSLPTGSGKTRVAVEAAVRFALRGDLGRPLLLWVAQTEELAEQAMEAFRHVWANEGWTDRELRIVRFFGGQRTPPPSDPETPTAVVSLIQTLATRADRLPEWLRSLSMMIIDESHHAIAPSYSDLLRTLGFSVGPRRKEEGSPEPVLLGLTATPFRSSGEEESRLLAQRFDARVVPRDQEGLYERLRDQGFLSRVSLEPIVIDEPFRLEADELAHLDRFGELPDSALQRLARVSERNRAILGAVESAPERSILLFANSVEHAEELAARLSLRGIRSRVVSGRSDRSARRDAVTAFRRGEVRVITNAQLFSTGFDAPGVEMVLIARPVFSPVRFMQMVGRGLRGPANGGTEHCRVVTVRDNIVGYSGVHPLEWWRRYYE